MRPCVAESFAIHFDSKTKDKRYIESKKSHLCACFNSDSFFTFKFLFYFLTDIDFGIFKNKNGSSNSLANGIVSDTAK